MIEKWQEEDYCLIRLGVPPLLWQNLRQMEQEAEEGAKQSAGRKERGLTSKMRGRAEDIPADSRKARRPKNSFAETGAANLQKSPSRTEENKRLLWTNRKEKRRKEKEQKEKEQKEKEQKEKEQREKKQKEKHIEKYVDKTKRTDSKDAVSREQKQQDALRVKRVAALLNRAQELQTALRFLGNNSYRTYCVYEDFLREKLGTKLWQQHWNMPEFADYGDREWVEKLMKYAVHDRFVVLGYVPCLPGLLCGYAGKMRSVKWFLKEKQYTQQLQDFIEDFYQEYGLAVELHLLEEGKSWAGVRPTGPVPINILDFSGEEKLSAGDVAKGSVWLDLYSVEGKCRRIETRNPGIKYVSLKKEWKQRQKESIHLDTISKNGYNT